MLRDALDSLLSQSRPADELIIVDDTEGNKTAESIPHYKDAFAARGTDLQYYHRTNIPNDGTGMTTARNRILEETSGDVVCYIDDDVICPDGWLSAYESAYDEFPNAAVIGGPGLDVDDPDEDIQILQTCENQNRLNKYGECQFINFNWRPKDPVKTQHIRGVNMSFRTSVLQSVGGFNPVYKGTSFYEETDVMARLWKQGEKIIYHPDVFLYHIVNGDEVDRINLQDPNFWYWSARNGIVFRYHVFPETFWIGLLRILLYTRGWPGPVWKELGAYIITQDRRRLYGLKGYIDGLRQVI